MLGAVERGSFSPDLQQHVAAGHRVDAPFVDGESASNQREEVAGLREWIFPVREVTAIGQVSLTDEVAVRE